MKMNAQLLIWSAVTLVVTYLLGFGVGALPALGPILEVRGGIWDHKPVELKSQNLPQLKDKVTVTIDSAGVPHIFASHEADLYFVQGYLMASQRLFQMDLSTRMAAGRLAEWFGSRTQEMDEFFIRFGMRESAETMWTDFSKDQQTVDMIDAFTAGVNTWIQDMPGLPAEYKIIGGRPEPFDRLRVIYMAKSLTFSLASRAVDLPLTVLKKKLGAAKVLDLYPEQLPSEFDDYVVAGMKGEPHSRPAEDPAQWESFNVGLQKMPFFPISPRGRGSNNWAVAPQKSATGESLLANDTHLGLSLPNVWHEVQLSVPNFNVYGVSLVSVPGIINGFNQWTAWGPTNGTTDVLDFYEVEFQDDKSNLYRYGDSWREAEVRTEKLILKGGREKAIAVIRTHLGYVMHREGRLALVANWMGHRTGNELKAVRNLYDKQNYRDCLEGLEPWYAPIQNFICIDQKNIAIQHTGYIPKREVGVGRFVMDGRSAENPFAQRIPKEWQPRLENPVSGFVQSANQRIVDQKYPFYLGWDYEEPFRGMGIRRQLKAKDKFSVDDFMALQNDAFDSQASVILPYLLKHLNPEKLSDQATSVVAELKAWDYQARASLLAPAVNKAWLKHFKKVLFEDEYEFPDDERDVYPTDVRVAWLLKRLDQDPNDSDSRWVDDQRTQSKENLSEMVTKSFAEALKELTEKMGKDTKLWTWSKWNRVHLAHVARLPGFGSDILEVDGSRESVRGINYRHGPVYKLIVRMGEQPEAWIQVPGGNQGDPFARDYTRHVDEWAEGKMRKVSFYNTEDQARSDAVKILEFHPEGKKL